jgi:putative transposase
MMDPGHSEIPIVRQCELLSLPRSTYYYNPREPDTYNDLLMRLIDEQFTKTPFYGVPRITEWLKRQGHPVNRKRVGRLMRVMGLEGIYPKRNLSQASKEHKIYPYLLRGLEIDHPDQVWCSDITYIRLRQGFVYLVAVMDWFSRYVLSWELSVTLDRDFCVRALDKALEISRPEIFNTDQGSQFTSKDFTNRLKDHDIRISMDGRGRAFDNIFIERLWRTIKYEEVYLHDYQNVKEAFSSLYEYFLFYDKERLHSSLGYCTAGEVYFKDRLVLPTEN